MYNGLRFTGLQHIGVKVKKRRYGWLLALYIVHCTLYITSCSDRTGEAAQFFLKGNVQLQKREYKEAIRYYTEAIGKKGDFADAYSNRGLAHYRNGDLEAAQADLTKAIQTDATFEPAYLNRADVFLATGQPTDALRDLGQIAKTYKDSTFYQTRLGEAYAGLNNAGQAQSAFDKAILLDPKNAEALTNRAALAFGQKRYADAQADLKQALVIDPNRAETLNNQALLLAQTGQYAQALPFVERALTQQPTQPYYRNNKGYLLLMLNRDAEAKPLIDDALRANDKNAWAHRNLGIYYLRQQQPDKALASLQQAEKLDSSVDQLYSYLGEAQLALGQKAQACATWQRGQQAGDEQAINLINSNCR
ncbi:tetratricopeptide repeat protein [Fibrella sp. HMF5036]|uniref:Tetratricopeptide repeat protein n=1 Tax=Fibrella aquatilis TaxID=2817059 RepID=A0A939G2Z3_9BACT|nr:tetratricopeptide repeat protein [Fibrella aquatilis]